jgi:hypothetical protein
MIGFNIGWGNLDLVVYFVIGVGTLIVLIPAGLLLIRCLNETWLDPDWRAACRERQQNSIESIIMAKRDPSVATCGWVLRIEAARTMAGTVLGAIVYLPGPLDGWFFFSMMVFGAGGALLGLFVNAVFVVLFVRWPK